MNECVDTRRIGPARGRVVPCTAAALLALAFVPDGAHSAAASASDPVTGYVMLGAGYEDNLFRFEDEEEAEATFGSDTMDDWYRYLGAGFDATFAGAERRFDVDGEVYRRTFDEFDDLDHTGGHFNADGTWALNDDTNGLLGYGYQRRLQSFTNKQSTAEDVVDLHAVEAGLEHNLGQRWQLRAGGGFTDFGFSTSDFLDKERLDAEAEIRYAASQRSIFGLLATWTESDFDSNDTRDFSGWSVGPSFTWHVTSSTEIEANVGWTHRGLDDPDGIDDYDDVTGYVQGRWQPGERFSTLLRVFRDVSSLGGEISEYTERTGIRFQPQWQMSPKVTGTLSLELEERDFSAVEAAMSDRKDDYFLIDLALAMAATQRLLLTVGYGYEQRDSNAEDQEFDAHIVTAEVRFDF